MYASLGQAAKATGVSRSTILRAIKAHRISAAKTDTGDWAIDPAELHRVFPPAPQQADQAADVAMTRQATAAEQAATALQITALHDLAELLRRQLDDVRDDRDHWRGMAEAGQRLLAPPRRVPWWRRLAG
jgi:excisionase family DNA binding protein